MLEIDGLRVNYGRTGAVLGASLNVDQGETVALIGPNGAGKSSVLRTVAGLVKPAAGKVTFLGRSIGGLPSEQIVRLGVSLVPEGRHIFSGLTVRENLLIGATGQKDKSAVEKEIERLLERFPILRERFKSSGGKLSGGEQQQLAIARALVSRPKLLLMDEPSLGLSPMMTDLVFEILKQLRSEGITILLVEQFAERAAEFADRTYVMRSGKVVLEGDRATMVQSKERIKSAYFGVAETSGGTK